jgi:hypothetical protein
MGGVSICLNTSLKLLTAAVPQDSVRHSFVPSWLWIDFPCLPTGLGLFWNDSEESVVARDGIEPPGINPAKRAPAPAPKWLSTHRDRRG